MSRKSLALVLVGLISCGGGRATSPPATPSPPAAAPEAAGLTYEFWSQSRLSGSASIVGSPSGERRGELSVLENGRGPQGKTHVVYGADGTLTRFEASGRDWIGKDAAESFSFEGRRASWYNMAEKKGEREVAAPAFYLPLAVEIDTLGGLVRALRRSGGRLPLLPEGEATLEELGEKTVSAGGQSRTVRGFAVFGLDLRPKYVWLDTDGEVFAMPNAWSAWVRKGWNDAVQPLRDAQAQHLEARLVDLARRHARKPAGKLALSNARVLAPGGAAYLGGANTVVIEGGRILEVRKTPPAGVEVIDVGGAAVVPGLWDSHQHLDIGDGALAISSGITTARDMANDPDNLDRYKQRFDDGLEIGPHIVRAGIIEGRNEKAASSKVTAETEAEALAGVDFYAKRGYDLIKIYNSVRPELVPVIARAAHERGMRVAGHVPVHMRAEEAVRAGYDELTHINMVFLNFFIDRDTDTRTPLRFSIVGEKGAGLDLESRPVEDFVKLLLEKKTVVDPTLVVFEDLFVARAGEIAPSARGFAHRLPTNARRDSLVGGLPVPEGMAGRYRDSAHATVLMVKKLHRAGVPIVAGTDFRAGPPLIHELELYVEAGMTPAEALATATSVPASVNKRQSGVIAPGRDADLIVVDGDPLKNIADLYRVKLTICGGTVIQAPELGEAMGIRRYDAH